MRMSAVLAAADDYRLAEILSSVNASHIQIDDIYKKQNGIYIYPRSHELNIHLFSYRQKCTRQFVTVKFTGVNEEQNRHQVTRHTEIRVK